MASTELQYRPERAPWGNFPPVIRCGDLGMLKGDVHYEAAKGGSTADALAMVQAHITDEFLSSIAQLAGGQNPRLVPVLAQEQAGRNKIPLALATCLGDALELEVDTDIVQVVRAFRTNKGADHRLAFCPAFDGPVQAGQPYIIMDDTLSMGGTLAALRGYIENRGGRVIGACALTAHPGALNLPVTQSMLDRIAAKHGDGMNDYWIEEFGYGIDQLTQGEAGHLRAAASVEQIRDRITAARNAAVASGNAPAAAGSETQARTLSRSEILAAGVSHMNATLDNGAADEHVEVRSRPRFGP